MNYKSKRIEKLKLKKLADKTRHCCGFQGGAYFDSDKGRYIKTFRGWTSKDLYRITNKRIRARKDMTYQNCEYKKVESSYLYW